MTHECCYNIDAWKCQFCGSIPVKEKQFFILAPELASSNDGFPTKSFSKLYDLEENNFWFRSRNQLIFWTIRKYFQSCSSLLEIGCGTGYVLNGIRQEFPHLKLYGSDIYTLALEFASKRIPDANLFQMDATVMPFKNEFELICAFDVLEHIEEDELVLQNIFQALRPKGGVIFTVPQHPFLWSIEDEYSCHKRRYTAKELRNKLLNAGYHIIKMTSFTSLLFPFMIISRFISRHSKNEFKPEKVLHLNPVLNNIFEKILSFERLLLIKGIPFSVGGSLLVIAVKGVES